MLKPHPFLFLGFFKNGRQVAKRKAVCLWQNQLQSLPSYILLHTIVVFYNSKRFYSIRESLFGIVFDLMELNSCCQTVQFFHFRDFTFVFSANQEIKSLTYYFFRLCNGFVFAGK